MLLKYIDRQRQVVKSIYTGIGKSTVIYPISFLVALGQGLVTLGIIFYIRENYGATPGQVGYFTAMWSLCYIIGCLFFRPLSDNILPRYVLIGASFFKWLLITIILLVKSFTLAHIFYGLFGVVIAFFWPPLMGWLSSGVEGEKLGKIMGRYNFSWSVGSILSPLLAGIMSENDPAHPLILGSYMFLLACILLIIASLTLPRIRSDNKMDEINNTEKREKDSSTPLRFPAWFGIFSTYTIIGVVVNIFPVFALENLGINKGIVGLLLQMRVIFSTFGFVLMGRTSFWHFRISQMLIGQIILAVGVFGLSFTQNLLFITMIIALIGLCMAISYFNSLFHGISGSINRSARMAVHESLISTGLILGSSAGGAIYQKFSMDTVYLFCAAFVFFGVIIQWALYAWFKLRNRVT